MFDSTDGKLLASVDFPSYCGLADVSPAVTSFCLLQISQDLSTAVSVTRHQALALAVDLNHYFRYESAFNATYFFLFVSIYLLVVFFPLWFLLYKTLQLIAALWHYFFSSVIKYCQVNCIDLPLFVIFYLYLCVCFLLLSNVTQWAAIYLPFFKHLF